MPLLWLPGEGGLGWNWGLSRPTYSPEDGDRALGDRALGESGRVKALSSKFTLLASLLTNGGKLPSLSSSLK